ncbi:MAG: molybdopterin/thiamine biosynthesis adenylyltransferase [Cyclobacteriaceae bacterium]|jgi:molybdopterin/thiamine biosynthesis adenylyltransferase
MNDQDLLRYNRQIMLPEIDIAGQEKLQASTALIIGLGGLGCPVALYLAAAGVGTLILADDDTVELSNLQRQIAHGTADIDRLKVASAADSIKDLNPTTRVETIATRLTQQNLTDLLARVDVVIDGTDNFSTRFVINDACLATRTPLVSGAAVQLQGQVMVVDPRQADAPCYRCLYQQATDEAFNCAENGVAAPVVGIIGTIQAMEALKLLAGFGTTLAGYLLVFDAAQMDWRKLKLPKNPACQACGR